MDARDVKALELTCNSRIRFADGHWLVPSQATRPGGGRYKVNASAASPSCECEDFQLRGKPCKHIMAVREMLRRQLHGEPQLDPATIPMRPPRPTYKQQWPAYNAAQTHEKERFLALLNDLCNGIQEPPRAKTGRPRILLRDAVFAACYKIYSTVSCRRFMTDLRDAHASGFIDKLPSYNSIFNYLDDPAVTPILKAMIVEASRPLAAVEVDFACDSTGFTTCRFERWFDHKYGVPRQQHDWCKLHFTTGVKTNIVTAVVIKERNATDPHQLPEMVRATRENFTVNEVSADKAYGTLDCYDAIERSGATPFVAFKSHHTGGSGGLWAKMFGYFQFRREEFLTHYHKRSNAESTVSMIKRKFGDSLRSKADTAMVNESLAKVVCHNIVVLIHEMYELGIEPIFWGGESAQKPAILPINSGFSTGS
jgi:transposase